MRRERLRCFVFLLVVHGSCLYPGAALAQDPVRILEIDPPESGFYAKTLDYDGIPIKAHAEVADAALGAARGRLERMLKRMPDVVANLVTEGVELHLIGKNQVT